MRIVAASVCGLLLMTISAGAWGSLGHKAVAEIAWRQMDPKERAAATRLLKHHPHYKELIAAGCPEGMDPDHYAFLNAAIWPDLLRTAKSEDPNDPEFFSRHNVYPHATLLPVVRTSHAKAVSLKNFVLPKPNATIGLAESMANLRDKSLSDTDRALSLAWVLHLSGDLHQPLHASTLVTPDEPKGHGAGGDFIVRDGNGEITSLHAFWDRIMGLDTSYKSISAFAEVLSGNPALAREKLPEYAANRTPEAWAYEGHAEAARFGYAEGRVTWVLKSDLAKRKVAPSQIPQVTPEYIDETRKVAHRRLALAAHRLTDTMKQSF